MVLIAEAVAVREARGDTAGAARLLAVSPVAWTHINFYGRYVFTETPNAVPVDDVVETMARYSFRAHVEDVEEVEETEKIEA